MAQPTDLMGLGENSFLAARLATQVNSAVVATGTGVTTAYQIPGTQFLNFVTNSQTSNSAGVTLPVVGGNSGCLLGDDFIIHNATGNTSLIVYVPSGGKMNVSGNNTTCVTLNTGFTATFWPVYVLGTATSNTSFWIGLVSN